MADWIGEDQIKDLMIAFSKFDTDNEGLIGVHQLRRVLYTLGQNPTDAELQVIIKNKSKCQIDEVEVERYVYFMNVSLDTIARWELLAFSTDVEGIVVIIYRKIDVKVDSFCKLNSIFQYFQQLFF